MNLRRTETYRGVKLKTKKGREWGYIAINVNGHDQGDRMGMDADAVLANLRATVDHAVEEPDRFSDEWQPGHKGVRDTTCWQNHRCA